jgi:hypothetical protein
MCFGDSSSVSGRLEVLTPMAQWMQVAHGLYVHHPMKMSQLQLRNDSQGITNAISHETWGYPNRGSPKKIMTVNWIHQDAERTRFPTSSTDAILPVVITTLRISYFYVTVSEQAFFTPEGMFNVHNSHLWPRDNPHFIPPRTIEARLQAAGITIDANMLRNVRVSGVGRKAYVLKQTEADSNTYCNYEASTVSSSDSSCHLRFTCIFNTNVLSHMLYSSFGLFSRKSNM